MASLKTLFIVAFLASYNYVNAESQEHEEHTNNSYSYAYAYSGDLDKQGQDRQSIFGLPFFGSGGFPNFFNLSSIFSNFGLPGSGGRQKIFSEDNVQQDPIANLRYPELSQSDDKKKPHFGIDFHFGRTQKLSDTAYPNTETNENDENLGQRSSPFSFPFLGPSSGLPSLQSFFQNFGFPGLGNREKRSTEENRSKDNEQQNSLSNIENSEDDENDVQRNSPFKFPFFGSDSGFPSLQSLFPNFGIPGFGRRKRSPAEDTLENQELENEDGNKRRKPHFGIDAHFSRNHESFDPEKSDPEEHQNRFFFGSLFPTLTPCNYTMQPGASCTSCNQALRCYPNNVGRLTTCRGLFRYCNMGRCSLFQGSACTSSSTVSPTTQSSNNTAG